MNMFFSIRKLIGSEYLTEDGEPGEVADFYFDDQTSKLGYVVVKDGTGLAMRKAVLPVDKIKRPITPYSQRAFKIAVDQEELGEAPHVPEHPPRSLQDKVEVDPHVASSLQRQARPSEQPAPPAGPSETERILRKQRPPFDPNLRSANEVIGYQVLSAQDSSPLGILQDFLANVQDWGLRYLAIETHPENFSGTRMLPLPEKPLRFDHHKQRALVDLPDKSALQTISNQPITYTRKIKNP